MIVLKNNLPTMDSFLNEFFNLNENNTDIKVNISEEEDSYTLQLMLVGLSKEDLLIDIEDGLLNIKTKENFKKDELSFNIKKEFTIFAVDKKYRIPEDVDVDNIIAKMENGILTVTLNKLKVTYNKNKQISIN